MQVLLALVGPMDRLHDGVVGSAGVFLFIYYTRTRLRCSVGWREAWSPMMRNGNGNGNGGGTCL